MSDKKEFAKLTWSAADVQTLAPRLSDKAAEDWLAKNEKHITGRLTELGWGVIQNLLDYDGVDAFPLDNLKEHDVVELLEDFGEFWTKDRGTIVYRYDDRETVSVEMKGGSLINVHTRILKKIK